MSADKKTTIDANWQETYASTITTAEQAVKQIRPGQRVFVGTGCGQPQELVRALAARGNELSDTEIVHLFTSGEAPYADRDLVDSFRTNTFFVSENVREIIKEGCGDYTPISLSDIPRLFASGQHPLDAALIQITPPDERGMCSLGISVDIVKSATENARIVVAEVNPNMPRTHGNSSISVHDIDYLVPTEHPILEISLPQSDETTRQIGEYVAALIEDGSTIEFGIGQIPQAVMEFLVNKKELGIHTEMFTDSIIDLIESGVVTGERKSMDRGKIVATFALGTKKLYDYIDDNPLFSFQPTEHVNDPYVIRQQTKQVAINVALEIDLTGQVCADSLGTKFYSGIGGQVDFNRGAAHSLGGKAIIAMPSTAKKGEISRIVARLDDGAGVVTTRGDVHYVVTEYGVAYLHGKSIQERTIALIAIAHPKFRPQLVKEAIEVKYLSPEMAGYEGKVVIGPQRFRTTRLLEDGTQISFRPVHPTDEPGMRDLFYALSQETIYYRFMSRPKHIPHKEIHDFIFIDHRTDVAIVATMPEAHGDDIIAIGRYYLDETSNMAEVAFTVRDDWQNHGIGSFLLQHLTNIARRNGIRGFTAEVLRANRAMQRVFQKSNLSISSKPTEDVISFEMLF